MAFDKRFHAIVATEQSQLLAVRPLTRDSPLGWRIPLPSTNMTWKIHKHTYSYRLAVPYVTCRRVHVYSSMDVPEVYHCIVDCFRGVPIACIGRACSCSYLYAYVQWLTHCWQSFLTSYVQALPHAESLRYSHTLLGGDSVYLRLYAAIVCTIMHHLQSLCHEN